MRERLAFGEAGDELALQALLYASGELEGEELAVFEHRLGQEQAARDALAQAVELTLTMSGEPAGPDPALRQRIRHRLRQRRRHRNSLSQSATFLGHPALWSAIGALVAVLVIVIIGQMAALSLNPDPPNPPAQPVLTIDEAIIWSDLHDGDHLNQVRDEEQKRKVEERRRPW